MEATRKSMIYRMIGTVAILFYGLIPGALITISMADISRVRQIEALGATAAIVGGALIFVWWPRKNKNGNSATVVEKSSSSD